MNLRRSRCMATLTSLLSAAALLGSASRAIAAPEVVHLIDFSATPDGDFTSYTEQGATFFATGGWLDSTGVGPTPNGTRGLYGHGSFGGGLAISALFNPPVKKVSVDLGDYNADADLMWLEAYDGGGALIVRQTHDFASDRIGMFTLTAEGLAIHKILFGSDGVYPNSVYSDNVQFVRVPEPAAASLLALAAAPWAVRRARLRGGR